MSEPISVHVTTREGEQRTVTQGAGHQTLMQVLYDEDIGVEAVCGGCTSCATCRARSAVSEPPGEPSCSRESCGKRENAQLEPGYG